MQKQRLGKGLRFATLLKVTGSGVLCGVCFGFVMSIVSNGFVIGVKWLTALREANPFGIFSLAGKELSLAPLISLIIAALLILAVRRIFRISRWHGPADSIYAAHRTDNELDIRAGFGSTLPPLSQQVVAHRSVIRTAGTFWCNNGKLHPSGDWRDADN